jgi:4-carboxymuconolactone decarboxylase
VTNDSLERGRARMKELFGEQHEPPEELEGDFIDITVGHLLGDIWTRPGLELRERSMITCTALIVLGNQAELKAHLAAALNVGITRQNIEEMMLHLAHYSGWPTAVNGLRVAREVFAELDIKSAT